MPVEKKDGFAIASPATLQGSLLRRLVPVADKLRDLNTRLGNRPYRVRVVRTTWSSGRKGSGIESVTHELELLPTPLVVDLSALSEDVTEVGRQETGVVQIQQISGRYTEDHLLGVDAAGNPPGLADSVYFEVESFRPDGSPAERRRMAVASAPMYNATQFQWTVMLDSGIPNRGRSGLPAGQ